MTNDTNMQDVIAAMCDGDERSQRTNAGAGQLQRSITPRDLLAWYAQDMEATVRQARGELYRIDAIEDEFNGRINQPLLFADGPQASKRLLCVGRGKRCPL